MWWLVLRSAAAAPRRLLVAALAVAFPVVALASTLLFVEHSLQGMTRHALAPVQVPMRATATSLDTDLAKVRDELGSVPGVRSVDVYGAADVVVGVAGAPTRVTARLVAIEPDYLKNHPWVRVDGDLTKGVLLNGGVVDAAGFGAARTVSIELRGGRQPLGLQLPVAGHVDVRQATAWYQIPAGDVQGDVVVTPRVVVVDYTTFATKVLPALRRAFSGPAAVTNPGLSELPPATLEAHVGVDPKAYPADPAAAVTWSNTFRRVLERATAGQVLVADNAVESLTAAAGDATSAELVFLLLGIPGVLVAGALGLAAASALAGAHRREDALLRIRGASESQLAQLVVGQGLLAGCAGLVVGLAVAAAGVSAVVGQPAWRDIPLVRLLLIAFAALVAGALTTATRLVPLVRGKARSQLAVDRRLMATGWAPTWRGRRIDIILLLIGAAMLGLNVAFGGLRLPRLDTDHQVVVLALSFYVLLAPALLWIGAALLAVRAAIGLLARRTLPDQARPLTTWGSAAVRWLGRRPAQLVAALVLGVLAVSFGAEVLTFTATYASAKRADAQAAFGADLRIEPATDVPAPLPDLGPVLAAVSALRLVPARAGSDRKTIAAIDPSSYGAAISMQPRIVTGRGVEALAQDRRAVVVSEEVASGFDVRVGDTLPVTVFPDDLDLAQKLDLRVAGIFRSFPPDDPFSELVISAAGIPAPVPAPDLYLARATPFNGAGDLMAALRERGVDHRFAVTTISDSPRQQQRSLTALNLGGLGRIEALVAALAAGVGVGVLGALLVLERRREFAVLRTIGATTGQLLVPTAVEATVAAVGSVLIGIPLGIGLAILAVRVLGIFFTLPPPIVTLPLGPLGLFVLAVLVASAVALTIALRRIDRVDVAALLREP